MKCGIYLQRLVTRSPPEKQLHLCRTRSAPSLVGMVDLVMDCVPKECCCGWELVLKLGTTVYFAYGFGFKLRLLKGYATMGIEFFLFDTCYSCVQYENFNQFWVEQNAGVWSIASIFDTLNIKLIACSG